MLRMATTLFRAAQALHPRHLLATGLLLASVIPALAQQALPSEVDAALRRAKLPPTAVSLLVADAQGVATPRLEHRTQAPMNPASVMKLLTTYAALEMLGPAFSWTTGVTLDGPVREGVLQGNLVIKGQGDPKLVVERLWLLLRRVQGLGVQQIGGDIVLDRSAFVLPPSDPASFDGEPLRPYNASADALLLNYKSLVLTFTPDPGAGVARIAADPPMAGVAIPATVPLSSEACGDYRASLRADFTDANHVQFAGSYPATCLERVWPVAYVDPASYAARTVEGMWRSMGGRLTGRVRDGVAPRPAAGALAPSFEMASPALAEVIRDINKFSNNVMAQQVFLTLGLAQRANSGNGSDSTVVARIPNGAQTSPDLARAALLRWWQQRMAPLEPPVVDNGSGLSRDSRISAQALGRLLQTAFVSPVMPEFMSSLPVAGIDGTMRRNRSRALGSAHLKTGSLRDVSAIAGYVMGATGKRYVVVAIINHPNASAAARATFDALLDWTVQDD